MNRTLASLVCCLTAALACNQLAHAQTFFYTGAPGGDFFDEANWNSAADGTGVAPVGDVLIDDTANAIALDLIIDGDTVEAAGQVDFGSGSLTLLAGSMFSITGTDHALDINAASTFDMTDSVVVVDDDVIFEGVVSTSGGSITSLNDDIEFQDNLVSLSIDGTTFSAGDNPFFDAFLGTIVGASFTSADRLGLRNSVSVVLVDTEIDIQGGTGDVDDVFAAAGAGSTLTLLGTSTLLAATIEEGVDLVLGGAAVATLGGNGDEILDDGSTATLTSLDAALVINEITDDPRAFIIDGRTGVDYATDPSGWNVTDWNGLDAVRLQLVPEPSCLVLAGVVLAGVALRREKS